MKSLPHWEARLFARRRELAAAAALILTFLCLAKAADNEFTGKFEPQLVADSEDPEHLIFKPGVALSQFKFSKPVPSGATVTGARLYNALTDQSTIPALLVEAQGQDPYLLVDLDRNNEFSEGERFQLKSNKTGGGYLWEATINEPLKDGPFSSFPIFIQYFKDVQAEELKPGERITLESTKAFARGTVDIRGKSTLVQYAYDPRSRKINPNVGRLGVDCDGNGEIDMDPFSAEGADAQDEVIVFRVGDSYVSTKRVDVDRNQIVLRSHPASDYKRIDLRMGSEFPDFSFTDFSGKKRKLSEFRGKYLLIDFWGTWCGPCRHELPYLKAAYSRYQARGFEILGMDTDDPRVQSEVKAALEKAGMTWTQATHESIAGVLRSMRVHSFPTTVLLGPDAKVISLSNTKKGQPDLRGEDLLRSLDKVLPR